MRSCRPTPWLIDRVVRSSFTLLLFLLGGAEFPSSAAQAKLIRNPGFAKDFLKNQSVKALQSRPLRHRAAATCLYEVVASALGLAPKISCVSERVRFGKDYTSLRGRPPTTQTQLLQLLPPTTNSYSAKHTIRNQKASQQELMIHNILLGYWKKRGYQPSYDGCPRISNTVIY